MTRNAQVLMMDNKGSLGAKLEIPCSRILVPVDFSKPSLSALAMAKALAKSWNAELDLVYVQDMPVNLLSYGVEGEVITTDALWEQMAEFRRWRKEELRKAVSDFPAKRVWTHIASGFTMDQILTLANRRKTGLIVMGTHGYTGLDKVFFGSATEAVVRNSTVPVLAVHAHSPSHHFAKIMVPYNMEPYADEALRYAITLAKSCAASVTVVQAVSKDVEIAPTLISQRLASVIGKEQAAALKVRAVLGDPREIILEESIKGKFDLIVLSTHRKPILSSYILGSTAENVLRLSTIPVLCIPSTRGKSKPKKHARWPII